MFRRISAYVFLFFIGAALVQCASRGRPTGGPKDVTPPQLVKADPENMSINFKANKIRLYFDELIKLEDVQEQLIISPPLKTTPVITPQGSASKYVEIVIKDTLQENTTYTMNFGQSIVDNNEGNPNRFFTYVFSTGSYIDSLEIKGAVKDAFNQKVDDFVSVMLYEIDSAYTDSTIFKKPPNYITNTLDSAVIFTLRNLKAGKYALFALKDGNKNNMFDQNQDKIGFIKDTVSIPTDSTFLLTLFNEIPNYKISVPSFAAENKIMFGYFGDGKDIDISLLTEIPDTVKTTTLKEFEKDTLNFWFTPFEMDSLIFAVRNETFNAIDTFTVKPRKVAFDSLKIEANQSGSVDFHTPMTLRTNTPLTAIDTSKIWMIDKDSLYVDFTATLDSIQNKVDFDFTKEPEEKYVLGLYPGALTDFFGSQNDTLYIRFSTKSYADYGNLSVNIIARPEDYPMVVQLTKENGEIKRELYADEPQLFEFNRLEPSKYLVRVIFDANGNKKWDTGNYLKGIQPERVTYYPDVIELRANWEMEQTFRISE
ncbi:Ig-like domain-containing protein [Maribacter polysaccharolyticus]|uniref:Ig-like domain-containing protein n=1 Tax=Maribacter polysaccharolyticus TaxID=3020831 RepID=UPI00237FC83D|nr:Ig-like domain-containing protein [Maribacter polysaccharolyticus]MDE3743093.1 Ig-like domain-containing protein [Maribacter polysaccharolyticus]